MDIKTTVQELCNFEQNKRHLFIEDFINKLSIKSNIYKYQYGLNIEVIIEGENKNHEILLMSHYDIFSSSIDGANDNSSSVSVLLHLIGYLKKNKPFYSIRIVFNDTEELVGGIYSFKKSNDKFNSLIDKCGSFQYLNNIDKSKIKFVLILELSGIGDSIFIASNSGKLKCSKTVNDYLIKTAQKNKLNIIEIPVLPCDYVSVHFNNLLGSVIGMIQFEDAKKYLDDFNKNGINKNNYPYIWKQIHTSLDNTFCIQEKALNIIFNFLIKIIENTNEFNDKNQR